MIITLIKMVNVDAFSSQNVNCSLSSSHTFVDLYLFMWRETVDFRVAEWIVCLVNFHYLANDKDKVFVQDKKSFRSEGRPPIKKNVYFRELLQRLLFQLQVLVLETKNQHELLHNNCWMQIFPKLLALLALLAGKEDAC